VSKLVALFGESSDAEEVCAVLRADGHQVSGYQTAIDELQVGRADVVVIDQPPRLSPSFFAWRKIEALCGQKPVLLFSDVLEQRAEARRWGAYYVGGAARQSRDISLLVERAKITRQSTAPVLSRQLMVGEGVAMLALRRALQQLAISPGLDVLLKGEPGSGKRTFARALHLETRLGGDFIEPQDARTLEAALAGSRPATVYLGDLASLSSPAQTKLGRALMLRRRSGNPVRFIAAQGHTAGPASRIGYLRPSLLHCFGVTLDIPALRERLDDMPLLAGYLLSRLSREQHLPTPRLAVGALKALKAQPWPGNVRQLENALRRALLLTKTGLVEASVLPVLEPASSVQYRLPPEGVDLQELEREVLAQALRLAGGNRTRAAALLGLTRDQVRYRLAKFDMLESEQEPEVA
jgi:two-component system response regulator AtoC